MLVVLLARLSAVAMAMGNVLACDQVAARLFAVAVAMAMIFTPMLVWVVRGAQLFAVAMPVVMMFIAARMATSRRIRAAAR